MIIYNQKETREHKRKGENKMFTVRDYNEDYMEETIVFEGTLEQCHEFIGTDEEFYIVASDGFTVID